MLNTSLAGLQSLLNQEIDDSQVEITLQNLLSNYQTTLEFKNTIDIMNSNLDDMNIKVNNLNNLDISQISADIDEINNVIITLKTTDISKLTLDNAAQALDITGLKNSTSNIQNDIILINTNLTELVDSYNLTKLLVEAWASTILEVETVSLKTKNDLQILNDKYIVDLKKLEDNITLLTST